jgi:hypothetical protein
MLRRFFLVLSIILISSQQVIARTPFQSNRNLISTQWAQLGNRIVNDDNAGEDDDEVYDTGLGFSVASSYNGKIVATGYPFTDDNTGQVKVHRYDEKSGSWVQMGQAIPNPNDSYGDYFGDAVALSNSGLVLAVSASRANTSKGFVSIFRFDQGENYWEQIGESIDGVIPREESGWAVALSENGNIVVIGAPNPTNESGSVRVFEYNGTNRAHEWNQLGDEIKGENAGDKFGYCVDIVENGRDIYVGVGAPMDENTAGSASVYQLNKGTYEWENLGSRYVDGNKKGTNLGRSISLAHDGTKVILAVGYPGPGIDEDSEILSGVEVYSITYEGEWDYYSEMIIPKEQYDNTGYRVDLSRDGQTLAISSPDYRDQSGLVRVFKYDKDSEDRPYKEVKIEIIGDFYDKLGFSIALSRDGNVISVGSNEANYVATYVISGNIKQSGGGNSRTSAFAIVVITFTVAAAVLVASFLVVKYTHCHLKSRGIEFSSIHHSNSGEVVENNQDSSFPIEQKDSSEFAIDDHDSDDGSGVSYENENIDYETHLTKIV